MDPIFIVIILISMLITAFVRKLGLFDLIIVIVILLSSKNDIKMFVTKCVTLNNLETTLSPTKKEGFVEKLLDYPHNILKEGFVGKFLEHPHDENYGDKWQQKGPEYTDVTSKYFEEGSRADDLGAYYNITSQNRAKEAVVRRNRSGPRDLKSWFEKELNANEEREWWNQDNMYDAIGRLQ